jgi:hypothetical protein
MDMSINLLIGRAMAQPVSRRPLIAKVRACVRVSPCGIFGGQNGTGTRFSPSSLLFPCQYNSTVALHAHISSRGLAIGPLVVAVQRRSLTPRT